MIMIGILCANLINYCTTKIKGGLGWHVSLTLTAVSAVIMAMGALFLLTPPTPSSIAATSMPLSACFGVCAARVMSRRSTTTSWSSARSPSS